VDLDGFGEFVNHTVRDVGASVKSVGGQVMSEAAKQALKSAVKAMPEPPPGQVRTVNWKKIALVVGACAALYFGYRYFFTVERDQITTSSNPGKRRRRRR
jgi:type VI protein secretion system component VasF